MSEQPEQHTAWCHLCQPHEEMPARDILHHLHLMHGRDIEPETWPDGSIVIVDETAETVADLGWDEL